MKLNLTKLILSGVIASMFISTNALADVNCTGANIGLAIGWAPTDKSVTNASFKVQAQNGSISIPQWSLLLPTGPTTGCYVGNQPIPNLTGSVMTKSGPANLNINLTPGWNAASSQGYALFLIVSANASSIGSYVTNVAGATNCLANSPIQQGKLFYSVCWATSALNAKKAQH